MNERISARLADAHNSLREQLDLAQQHFERLEQVLAKRESKDIANLNRAARRLRAFENREQWSNLLVDAAQGFAGRAALFTLQGSSLHLEAARNTGRGSIGDVALDSAPAFRSAVETRDAVVALRTRGEMSPPIAEFLGEAADDRFYLFPIATRERVAAVLYADDAGQGSVQPDALELLASLAGAVLESRASEPVNGLVKIAHNGHPKDAQDLHRKAQRFARLQVAEIRLYKSENVLAGRTGRDLYTSLKSEIDGAREVFRRDFLSTSGDMVDYLHIELVHTLANDEVALLGPDYPGPLA
ncbi:MAG: hypothetical protein LAP38_06840 [Acidobacteriia bacterium]|nr:hypothetical protein [Terriglobia bacterium]